MSENAKSALDHLLDRLHAGDAAAAADIFVAYEPLLRRVVRRHLVPALRTKLDSVDVVQSVWVDLLRDLRQAGARLRDGDHLAAYLTRAARNRLIDRFRQHRAALRRQQALPEGSVGAGPAADEPRPSQAAQAAEVWQQIQALCSPLQATVVRLRREGRKVDEIAAQTGLHPSSVRRLLYDLARRLGVQRKQRA